LSKRIGTGWLEAAFLVSTLAWPAALVAASYAVTHRSPRDVGFRAGAAVYLLGSLVCHQRADRSFHLWHAQLPVCGRCAGIYFGGAFGAALALILRRWTVRRLPCSVGAPRAGGWRRIILLGSLPAVASVLLEWVGLLNPSTGLRAATGVPLGLVVVWLATAAVHHRRTLSGRPPA
jgi:uncharacterized membrane protein